MRCELTWHDRGPLRPLPVLRDKFTIGFSGKPEIFHSYESALASLVERDPELRELVEEAT